MTKKYQKPRSNTYQINLELGFAAGCILFARWSEPNSIEDAQWAVFSFMAWAMSIGLIISAIRKMKQHYLYERHLHEIFQAGKEVKTASHVSDELMKSRGIVGDE